MKDVRKLLVRMLIVVVIVPVGYGFLYPLETPRVIEVAKSMPRDASWSQGKRYMPFGPKQVWTEFSRRSIIKDHCRIDIGNNRAVFLGTKEFENVWAIAVDNLLMLTINAVTSLILLHMTWRGRLEQGHTMLLGIILLYLLHRSSQLIVWMKEGNLWTLSVALLILFIAASLYRRHWGRSLLG